MKKGTKVIGTVFLAASLFPLSAFAASPTSVQPKTAEVEKLNHTKKHDGHCGFLSQNVIKSLGLDETKVKEGFAAGKTLATIASEQGVSREKLIEALKSDMASRLNQAVKDGKITQAQANKKLKNATQHITNKIDKKMSDITQGFHGGKYGKFFHSTTLKSLGLDEAKVKEGLSAGKTLATIASEHGISREKLIVTLKKDMTDRLTQAVKDGKITQEQADKRLKYANKRITKMIDGKMNHSLTKENVTN